MNRFSRLASAILLLAAASACSKAQARIPGPVTALEMPPPPARVLIPVVLNAPVEPEPVEAEPEPATPPPARPRSAPAASRPAAETTPPATVESPPQPVLQTTADAGAIEGRILASLSEAQQNLNRVRPGDLNASARAQYDSAIGFIRIANGALKVKNYMYAEQLASKAATIAAQLVKG